MYVVVWSNKTCPEIFQFGNIRQRFFEKTLYLRPEKINYTDYVQSLKLV